MAERTVDLQLVLAGLRRRRGTVLALALSGGLLGAGAVLLSPPMYASSSLVLLPTKAAEPNQMAELVKTDIRIAMSESVLGPAARSLRPRMSADELARHVRVTAVTPLVLEIQGRAERPGRAEDISMAVANADVTYVTESLSSPNNARRALLTAREKELRGNLKDIAEQVQLTTARLRGEDPQSPQGKADATALASLTAEQSRIVLQLDQLQSQTDDVQPSGGASVIQRPSPAERDGLLTRVLGAALAGALVAVILAAAVITLLTRRDPKLYFRDDIADAVGSPVVASVHSRRTRSVADWTSLLHDYTPGTVDAWAWRQALRQLVFVRPQAAAGRQRVRERMDHPGTITVISLSGDPRGLAVGPLLAGYVASAGIRTHLVPAQRHESAAALWAACARLEDPGARPALSVGARHDDEPQVDLTVVLLVLDRQEPKLLDLRVGSVVVLGLSPGSASAEELARVAVAVDEVGERIDGIVVADPDDLDRTTGRLLQHDRTQQVPLPTRLTGAPTPRSPRSGGSAVDGGT